MSDSEQRKEWWIDNPPWCWRFCTVATFDSASGPQSIETESGDFIDGKRVHVIEVKENDPDFDAILAAIDIQPPKDINEDTCAEAAEWIRNVMTARCHTGNLKSK